MFLFFHSVNFFGKQISQTSITNPLCKTTHRSKRCQNPLIWQPLEVEAKKTEFDGRMSKMTIFLSCWSTYC